jgi:hypothetical protein
MKVAVGDLVLALSGITGVKTLGIVTGKRRSGPGLGVWLYGVRWSDWEDGTIDWMGHSAALTYKQRLEDACRE